MIDYLNEVATPPHGIYSTDIDHSGQLLPADILRVIDLLNGSGRYVEWLGVSLPDAPCSGTCPGAGGSGVVDIDQAFVNMLVDLLETIIVDTPEKVFNFDIYIEWIKHWCVDYVDPDAQDYLVKQLADPTVKFQSGEGEEAANEIVHLLSE